MTPPRILIIEGRTDWVPVAPTPWGTGARAPTFTNGWARGHREFRRTANKKLTKTVLTITNALTKTTNCAFRAKKWRGTTKKMRRIVAPPLSLQTVPPLSDSFPAPLLSTCVVSEIVQDQPMNVSDTCPTLLLHTFLEHWGTALAKDKRRAWCLTEWLCMQQEQWIFASSAASKHHRRAERYDQLVWSASVGRRNQRRSALWRNGRGEQRRWDLSQWRQRTVSDSETRLRSTPAQTAIAVAISSTPGIKLGCSYKNAWLWFPSQWLIGRRWSPIRTGPQPGTSRRTNGRHAKMYGWAKSAVYGKPLSRIIIKSY